MRPFSLATWLISSLAVFAGACCGEATQRSVVTSVPADSRGDASDLDQEPTRGKRTLRGEASFYADFFAGRKTANGERYDPRKLTAANRTLPFGTRVRITRVDNGRSVVVRVNDRGPFGKRRRIFDLSKAAARQLDMLHVGRAEVQAVVLD